MKTMAYWFVVEFPDGSRRAAVVNDPCDTVQFQGGGRYFESEAYHLASWCHEHGFKFYHGEMELELPVPEAGS